MDVLECFEDMREYDVPYYVRVSIDADVRVGCWYSVTVTDETAVVTKLASMVEKVRRFYCAAPRGRSVLFVCVVICGSACRFTTGCSVSTAVCCTVFDRLNHAFSRSTLSVRRRR
jgi:DNA polymerase elongation subunit (family B)